MPLYAVHPPLFLRSFVSYMFPPTSSVTALTLTYYPNSLLPESHTYFMAQFDVFGLLRC